MLQFVEDIQEFLGRMEDITKKRQPGYKGFWRGKGIKISIKIQRNQGRGEESEPWGWYGRYGYVQMMYWHEKKISNFCGFSLKIKIKEALLILLQIDTSTCFFFLKAYSYWGNIINLKQILPYYYLSTLSQLLILIAIVSKSLAFVLG